MATDCLENKPAGPVIYCGPNLQGGILAAFTVFCQGIPVHISALMAKAPEISELIVPVENMHPTVEKTMTKGTRQHECYVRLLSFNNKER